MAIYKQTNDPFEGGQFYHCEESSVVHFGTGDVLISAAKRPLDEGGFVNEILFTPDEARPIGEYTEKHRGKPTQAPVVLRFDKQESVTALIGQLLVVKDTWSDDPTGRDPTS